MSDLWLRYIPILWLIVMGAILVAILFFISYFFGAATAATDFEKLTTYECGFEPFITMQGTFDVKFYLLAMLFMVFDLEIMFILPGIPTFDEVTITSMLVFLWFTGVLILAFVYEWLKGSLDG